MKMASWLLFLLVILIECLVTEGVLPPYVPALRGGQRSRYLLINSTLLGFGYT